MNVKDILSACDHTLLKVDAKWSDIQKVLDDGIKYGVASACIPPCFVKRAKDYVQGKLKICTVIGFPNGYNSTKSKVFETQCAIDDGADEIDMVINIGAVKDGDFDYVAEEIALIKQACGDKILKVIIETCLLSDDEKVKLANIVVEKGADYVKTSTGFSTYGATFYDVELLKKSVGKKAKVKASGGITSLADANRFIELGASRLGTSKIVKIIAEKEKE
jgi:deoxyribose-phosphate aldolase